MLHRWCNQTVTVIRAPEKVERGSVIRDWENAREHVVKGCSVQPTASTRDFAKREEQSTAQFHMFAPPMADIKRGDRIKCDVGGEVVTFELDGVPYQRFSPTGRVDSTQCDLIVWEG
ncbi:MAG: hypothetical protein IJ087_19715 [Eggerthellaceae bacterium]|nr:hypothetical protein [Eggerthellaceae bacterium]